MNEEIAGMDPYLGELLFQLQGSAWIHMGKVANPGSGKVERNMEAARGAIDMLGMLETKTRGNLTTVEEGVLRELLQQVRLNFVSEQEKGDAPEVSIDSGGEAAASDAAAGDSAAANTAPDATGGSTVPEEGPPETSGGPEASA